jgi:hypothetical protein
MPQRFPLLSLGKNFCLHARLLTLPNPWTQEIQAIQVSLPLEETAPGEAPTMKHPQIPKVVSF